MFSGLISLDCGVEMSPLSKPHRIARWYLLSRFSKSRYVSLQIGGFGKFLVAIICIFRVQGCWSMNKA